jgi:hypothetical protein
VRTYGEVAREDAPRPSLYLLRYYIVYTCILYIEYVQPCFVVALECALSFALLSFSCLVRARAPPLAFFLLPGHVCPHLASLPRARASARHRTTRKARSQSRCGRVAEPNLCVLACLCLARGPAVQSYTHSYKPSALARPDVTCGLWSPTTYPPLHAYTICEGGAITLFLYGRFRTSAW